MIASLTGALSVGFLLLIGGACRRAHTHPDPKGQSVIRTSTIALLALVAAAALAPAAHAVDAPDRLCFDVNLAVYGKGLPNTKICLPMPPQ